MLKDGAVAWEVKDFLVQQDRCEEVTIEGKSYPGKASTEYKVSYNRILTGPRSSVGNMSGCRYVSNCRSMGTGLIPAGSQTFLEIDHEIVSTVKILPSP